ncbi:hypothetical protein LPTSP3_g32030 [Leptospira kobayashii]|uniref:Uncharacterized protein n=1 Tax=Leptospira kobayashii TaxID=1917830 RepID=A0ABM7UMK2_9LEPT|nr:hypothetical protein [Leptospira kobayashii]BDA80273.1 hypothetical protein LPTSP3_g32030 [Leptospira kobayashii]
MKRSLIIAAIILGIGINNCKNESKPDSQTLKQNKNLISIVEIPATDFSRAVTFYQTLLGVKIEKIDMEGTQMGILPNNGYTVNVVLVKGNGYIPKNKIISATCHGGIDSICSPVVNFC